MVRTRVSGSRTKLGYLPLFKTDSPLAPPPAANQVDRLGTAARDHEDRDLAAVSVLYSAVEPGLVWPSSEGSKAWY